MTCPADSSPTAALDDTDRSIVNALQSGLPLVPRPYAEAAQALGIAEDELLARLRALLAAGVLTRFGPLYQIERAGGRFVLCACMPRRHGSKPLPPRSMPSRKSRTTTRVPTISTCGSCWPSGRPTPPRRHWRASPPPRASRSCRFPRNASSSSTSICPRDDPCQCQPLPDAIDLALIHATQAGLPLTSAPYAAAAEQLGIGEAEVIQRLAAMQARGVLRRIGAVPNHYRLGWRANGMTVWDVDDARIDALGERIGAPPFVSHCYRRPRRLPQWPYNLFAMVHAHTRAEAVPQIARIAMLLGDACRAQRRAVVGSHPQEKPACACRRPAPSPPPLEAR